MCIKELWEVALGELFLLVFYYVVLDGGLVFDFFVECLEDPFQLPPVEHIYPAEPDTHAVHVVVLEHPLGIVSSRLKDEAGAPVGVFMLRGPEKHDSVSAVGEGSE